jgi:hypothetical protein
MADKRILKVTARQAAVEVVGSGSATISIYDLIHTRQTIDVGNVELTITDVAYDVGNSANIKREGNLVLAVNAGQNEINLTEKIGAALVDKISSNVVVNLGEAEGTMIIQFTKGNGYVDPDRQNLQPRER